LPHLLSDYNYFTQTYVPKIIFGLMKEKSAQIRNAQKKNHAKKLEFPDVIFSPIVSLTITVLQERCEVFVRRMLYLKTKAVLSGRSFFVDCYCLGSTAAR